MTRSVIRETELQLARGKSYKLYMFPQASHLDFECSWSCTTMSTKLNVTKDKFVYNNQILFPNI